MVKKPSLWQTKRKRGVHISRRKGWPAHLREYLWPSMGMRAFAHWVMLGLRRDMDRPHYVAMGVACGVWTAFNPLLGTHIIIVGILCWLFRASFLGGLAGTCIANPWMLGFIWAMNFKIGHTLLGLPVGNARATMHSLHWSTLGHDLRALAHAVVWPTLLGGVILGIPVAAAFYALVYWQINALKKRRKKHD